MSFITMHQVGVLSPLQLFQNLDLTVGPGDRIGIIAGNGGGKSTLLRCIAGMNEPTTGELTYSRGLRLGFVEQNVPVGILDLPLLEAVRNAIPPARQVDGFWLADVALAAFQTPEDLWMKPIRHLSGGWQRLALIARALVLEPDALLLDEPTNHLDIEKIRLLEGWIKNDSGRLPMMIASHDRSFLDSCTTHTLFLRPDVSKIYAHPYSRARQLLQQDDMSQGAQFERDLKEAARLRRSAAELRNIGINSHSDAAQKKSKMIAQRAETLECSFKPPHKEQTAMIRLNSSDINAKALLSINDLTVTKPDGHPLFNTGKLRVLQGERIILLGENGAGKSQLIKALLGAFEKPDDNPDIKFSPSAIIGYADQQMSHLPDEKTPLDFIAGRFSIGDQRSRSLLAGAGFPVERQIRPIREFSHGQKARLGMLALRLVEPNFYLLDEPTNHVDIKGQEKLEEEILLQKATCIIVSHDRSFVRAIGTRYLKIEKRKIFELEEAEI